MDGIDTNVDLDDRIAVVTGSDGIGRELAINLAMAGAKYTWARNLSNTESSIIKAQGRKSFR